MQDGFFVLCTGGCFVWRVMSAMHGLPWLSMLGMGELFTVNTLDVHKPSFKLDSQGFCCTTNG